MHQSLQTTIGQESGCMSFLSENVIISGTILRKSFMSADNSHTNVYKSRRGKWISIFVWFSAFLLSFFSYGIIISNSPLIERIFGSSITLIIAFIAPWFWFTTRYRISSTSLHLQSGMLHKELKLQEIQRVTYKGDGSGYSFALSRDSIHIVVEGSERGYKVSPINKRGFMEALGRDSTHLVVEGDDLVTPPSS